MKQRPNAKDYDLGTQGAPNVSGLIEFSKDLNKFIDEEGGSIVAIKERSSGNESVGSMWLETKIFTKDTPVGEIIAWGEKEGGKYGKLIITEAESDAPGL